MRFSLHKQLGNLYLIVEALGYNVSNFCDASSQVRSTG